MFSMIMFCMIMCCIIIIISSSSSSSRGVIIKGGGDCSPGLAIDNVSVINVVIAVGLCVDFGRGDDTVGNPHQAQISQFEPFELILLLKLDSAPLRTTPPTSATASCSSRAPAFKRQHMLCCTILRRITS